MSTTTGSSALESTSIAIGNGPRPPVRSIEAAIADDLLYELVDGEIVEKEMGAFEVDVASMLFEFLGPFVRARRLGRAFSEMIFRIDQARDLQRRPDVAFVSHAKWPVQRRAPEVVVWDMVPDLAIEVVSQSNTANHVQGKIHEYFKAGVVRDWVVYPREREVYVYASPTEIQVLQLGSELDGGELIPGFRLPLSVLFEDAPE